MTLLPKMTPSKFYPILLLTLSIGLFLPGFSEAFSNGGEIIVKMSLNPDNLWEFYLRPGMGTNIRGIEEDAGNSDDTCDGHFDPGAIIRRSGRITDSMAWTYGGCDPNALTVLNRPYNSGMGTSGGGNRSLSGGGYTLRADILVIANQFLLCDEDNTYQANGKKWECLSGTWTLLPNTVCKDDGMSETCSADDDCCNKKCILGHCGCSPPGEACITAPDCCGTACTALVCGCTAFGAFCWGPSDCCTDNNCSDNICCPAGQKKCYGACTVPDGSGNCPSSPPCVPDCSCANSLPTTSNCTDPNCGITCPGGVICEVNCSCKNYTPVGTDCLGTCGATCPGEYTGTTPGGGTSCVPSCPNPELHLQFTQYWNGCNADLATGCWGTCNPALCPGCAAVPDGDPCADGCGGMTCTGSQVFCGDNTAICGNIGSAEAAIVFKGNVELRDVSGNVLQTKKTNPLTGDYIFPGLTAGAKYFVSPVADRKQTIRPSHAGPTPRNRVHNFKISSVPGKIDIFDEPGTFVVLTPAALAGSTLPPDIDQTGATLLKKVHSATVGLDKKATLAVPFGSYYLTCWKHCGTGSYTRKPASGSIQLHTGSNINPDETWTEGSLTTPACGTCP